MRSTLLIAAVALAGTQVAAAQSLKIGDRVPEIKAHKVVQGDPVKFGDGKLHVIEMFATW